MCCHLKYFQLTFHGLKTKDITPFVIYTLYRNSALLVRSREKASTVDAAPLQWPRNPLHHALSSNLELVMQSECPVSCFRNHANGFSSQQPYICYNSTLQSPLILLHIPSRSYSVVQRLTLPSTFGPNGFLVESSLNCSWSVYCTKKYLSASRRQNQFLYMWPSRGVHHLHR